MSPLKNEFIQLSNDALVLLFQEFIVKGVNLGRVIIFLGQPLSENFGNGRIIAGYLSKKNGVGGPIVDVFEQARTL